MKPATKPRKPTPGISPIGVMGLIGEFGLEIPLPAVRSYAGSSARRTVIEPNLIRETYPSRYRSKSVADDLRFALRYEPIDLGFYAALFRVMPANTLLDWIRREPKSKFTRKAWFLYEHLTGRTLDQPDLTSIGYVDLLDDRIQLTGQRRRSKRHAVNDNLLGGLAFCPLVRRTKALDQWAASDLATRAAKVAADASPSILTRAVDYLYTKETKSSFEIEGERPGPARMERFIRTLEDAASFDTSQLDEFVRLQNAIVDPRFAEPGWRTDQNYIAETRSDYSEKVYFVPPKPEDLDALMAGWMSTTERVKIAGIDPVVAAAAVAFGFVFLHPFTDGNGRIHRFLVHHVLSQLGFTPPGVLFPVSSVMLRDRRAYDEALATYSASVMPFIDYTLDDEFRMKVSNDTAELYRYFDATPLAEYLYACVDETIRHDFQEEISFLVGFDRAMQAILEIVDMPNRRASLLIRLIRQNGGQLSATKRPQFSELTDTEIAAIESAINTAWD